jgi:hypothetical protein
MSSVLEATRLTDEQIAAASEVVTAWLEAWKRGAWGTMSSLCQTPQAVGVGEPEMCAVLEQRLALNHLEEIGTVSFDRGNIEKLGDKLMGFADFKVPVTIRGVKTIHVGIIPRVVFDGSKWGVNFTSINRRFDPKKEG